MFTSFYFYFEGFFSGETGPGNILTSSWFISAIFDDYFGVLGVSINMVLLTFLFLYIAGVLSKFISN